MIISASLLHSVQGLTQLQILNQKAEDSPQGRTVEYKEDN